MATLGTAVCIIGVWFVLHSARKNTPLQNKQIEIQAFKTNNPSLCGAIKGDFYYFGGTDNQIFIPQAQARKQCENNIKSDTEPYLIGI